MWTNYFIAVPSSVPSVAASLADSRISARCCRARCAAFADRSSEFGSLFWAAYFRASCNELEIARALPPVRVLGAQY